jgi:ribose transport system substrate-binding protein
MNSKGEKVRKVKLTIIAILVIAMAATTGIFVSCKTPEVVVETVVETVTETVTETVEVEKEAEAGGMFKVGYSNGLITHSWRTQMIEDVQKDFLLYQGQGRVSELLIQHAGNEVDLQIQQIRQLISAGVDLLLINPNSWSALDPVVAEAKEAGILVFIVDQRTTTEDAYQVIPDIYHWQQDVAKYVFEGMGEEGNVFYLSGYDGSPANTDRDNAFYDLLEEYPNINLLGKANGNWDPTTSQQVMSEVLAAHQNIDGVVTHDGEALGTIRAFEAANRPLPAINGEATRPFFEYWLENMSEGFSSFAITNSPGFASNLCLGIGLRMLEGKQIKDGIFLPDDVTGVTTDTVFLAPLVSYITDDNVQEIYDEHITKRGLADYIDIWYTQEELDALFE